MTVSSLVWAAVSGTLPSASESSSAVRVSTRTMVASSDSRLSSRTETLLALGDHAVHRRPALEHERVAVLDLFEASGRWPLGAVTIAATTGTVKACAFHLRALVEHRLERWRPPADPDDVEAVDTLRPGVERVVGHHATESPELLETGLDLGASRAGALHGFRQQDHGVVVLRGDDARLRAVAVPKRLGPRLALGVERRHVFGHDQDAFGGGAGFLQDRLRAEVPVADDHWVSGQGGHLLQEGGALGGFAEGDDRVGGSRLDLVELWREIAIVGLPRVPDHRGDPVAPLQDLDEQVGPRVMDAHPAAEHRQLLGLEGLRGVAGEQVAQECIARPDAEDPLSPGGRARAGASDEVRDPGLLDRVAACHGERAEQLPDDGRHS